MQIDYCERNVDETCGTLPSSENYVRHPEKAAGLDVEALCSDACQFNVESAPPPPALSRAFLPFPPPSARLRLPAALRTALWPRLFTALSPCLGIIKTHTRFKLAVKSLCRGVAAYALSPASSLPSIPQNRPRNPPSWSLLAVP